MAVRNAWRAGPVERRCDRLGAVPRASRRCAAARLALLACLQASLAFYNPNQNWLTRQFALEYASLFDVTLPVLAAYGQPLPLGGTSNHFRTRVLRDVGGWDPHNVTEDADLGLRLDRLGEALTCEGASLTPAPVDWLDLPEETSAS